MRDHAGRRVRIVLALLAAPLLLGTVEFEQEPGGGVVAPREPVDVPFEVATQGGDGPVLVPGDGPTDGTDGTGLVVTPDEARTPAGVPVRIDYAENDVYPEPVVVDIATAPAFGEAFASTTDGAHIIYSPLSSAPAGGAEVFEYRACSQARPDVCATTTVTVAIVTDEEMRPPTTDRGDVVERAGPTAPQTCQQPVPWGGHDNGRIPEGALASIGQGQRLMSEAAKAFTAMQAAAADDGVAIRITDSYRSFAAQVRVREQKGAVVATARPGTSVHGWGKALDINVRDAGVKAWLEANSRRFAWINPPWAKRPGKSFEPWHYEYYGVGADADNPQCEGIGAALTASGSDATPPPPDGEPPIVLNRTTGLGLGAVVALVGAGVLVARDLARGRVTSRGPWS